MIGDMQEILVTEVAFDNKSLVGHNKYYQQVLVSTDCQSNFDHSLMGRLLKVQIISAEKHHLKCKVIQDVSPAAWNVPQGAGDAVGVPNKISEQDREIDEGVELENSSNEDDSPCNTGACCGSNSGCHQPVTVASEPVQLDEAKSSCPPTGCCMSQPVQQIDNTPQTPTNRWAKTIFITVAALGLLALFQTTKKRSI